MNRRDVLTALLGAPAALAACRARPPPPVAGDLLGQSFALGHRLRDAPPTEAAGEPRRVEVAIVGAGPSGLSAAWRLDAAGVRDFVVLELEDRAGGTSRYGEEGVVAHPWGAHYVPAPPKENRALVRLLREMGAVVGEDAAGEPVFAEEQLVRAPEERLFHQGAWCEGLYPRVGESPEERADLQRFHAAIDRWVSFRDARGRRAFAIPMATGSDDAEVRALDRLSMAEWLDREGLRSARLRWLVDYACRDDYGLGADLASAWAGLFYFCSRVPRAGAEAAPLLAWPEGNGRLVRHLAKVVGPRLRTGAVVANVANVDARPGAEARAGVRFDVLDAATGRWTPWLADHAIVATPRHVARRIVRDAGAPPPPPADGFTYGPWLVANLHLRGRPREPGFPLAWDNVIHGSASLGYVAATHQRLLDHGPTIFTWYMPLTDADPKVARERMLVADHAGYVDAVLADLRRPHPDLRTLVDRIDVFRWGHAMVQPRVGFVWGGAREKAASPLGAIRFAHSDLSGVALFEEAQHRGVLAAEGVLADRGARVDTWL